MRNGFLTVLLLGLLAPSAWGNEDAARLLKKDLDRLEQERRERRWDEAHTPGAPAPSTAAPGPAAAPGPCFAIRRIQLHPADILAPRRVAAIVAGYEGRCLGAADLAALQQALNAQALAQGLVTTRVVVPEQNLAAGALRLEVWPGHLERLEAPALSHRELRLATPLRPGDPVQLRALEQTVDNLSRLASFRTSLELQPGTQPGGSVAQFNVTRGRPWQAGLAWQGEDLAGRETHALRGSLTLDSPLRLADRLTLGVNGNLQDGQVDDAHGGSLDYDLPWGWWRASLGADRFDYENPVRAGLTPFTASGKSRSWRSELARTVYRDARQRWSLALHGKERLSDNFIDQVTIGVSSTRVHALGLRSDFSRVAAPWVWDVSLDAENGRGRTPTRVSPIDSEYMRLTGSSRLQYHFERASLSGSLQGQWSDARLAASEQFALGGQVPGFSPVSLNANTGLGLQLELARPLLFPHAGFSSLRPRLTAAWALAPHAGGNPAREELAALTVGITAPWLQNLVQASVSWPLEGLSSIDAPQGWQLDAGFSRQW